MAQTDAKRPRNALLRALPQDSFALLEPHLEPIDLPRRFSIAQPNRKIAHAYFLDSGIASIVASAADDAQVEIGIIGREGMTAVAVIHGADRSPYSIYMQVEGAGHRIPVTDLRAAMADNAACRKVFLASAQGLLLQVSETAVVNARATIAERLARWLLMARDRVDDDEIPLTHEFIAMMMGARRPGVTEAVHDLTRRGLITGERGKIVILDRSGLEEHAGRYYGVPERELKRLLG
jgi:CRP-like cAMP-binding protein